MSDERPPAEDFASVLNASRSGWNAAMGLRFVRATRDEVIGELEIGEAHRQPYGLVHGGVYAGIIEAAASVGAALDARAIGRGAVGLENHTSFLRAVREGMLRVVARPLARGRRTQVWEATVRDGEGRELASGRVRLLVVEPDVPIAGEAIAIDGEEDRR
ncbi:PaaI family thioesterase [Sandaracinus amylolyticus]|uniref:PaaI family thioesterase n=1 Tax=Sandaracinus amylolyticus TaxID=927083 RepID=UPI001F1BDD1F|nr:PaaI family thioesterase [Sandaracinus amylolyticus]